MEENTDLTSGTAPETLPEGQSNLTICPNCLEPNSEDLAVCRYCGMPLHPGADADPSAMPESEEELAANRAAAAPEEKKDTKKNQQSGFQRVMPWLGLYLIYYAITGCFDVKRQVAQAAEAGQPVNETLAYVSQGIWFLAGLLMARPLIKKGWRKLRHLPEEDETPETPEAQAEEEVLTDTAGTAEEEARALAAEAEPVDAVLPAAAEEILPDPAEEEETAAEAEAPAPEDLPEDPAEADMKDSEFEDDDETAKWL